MDLRKEFKLFILPVFKGFPLLIGFMLLGYLIASYGLQYITPVYEVGAKIKLDNRELGIRDFELFENEKNARDGSNFLTEVEVFKTKSLQRKALEKLDFQVSYFKSSSAGNQELYKESPFVVDYKILDSSILDQSFYLKYVGNGKFRFFEDAETKQYVHSLKFNKAYTDSTTVSYRLRRNNEFLSKNAEKLQVGDVFSFRINNLDNLVKQIDNSNFFCQPVDKEVYIVKLHYKHEHPEKAADFLNALLNTYIDTDHNRKNRKASKMLSFIEKELDSLGVEMQQASLDLAAFRKNNNIINPKQETEAILRQLNQFDINKLSLDLKEIELNNIYDFLKSDKQITGFSPDFETVKDDVFEHTFMDLKKLEVEKFDLRKKFPESSLEIQTINAQIKELKQFVFKSIEKKLINIEEQRSEISGFIDKIQSKFESYPDKERQLAKLERDFQHKEETFNYLTKKKLELDIAHSADHSLHEVVDYATVPKRPTFPNVPLIKGIVVFASLILGLIIIYALNFFFRTVSSIYELKEKLDFPMIGTVIKQSSRQANQEAILNLYSNVLNLGAFEGQKMITLSSLQDNEGKTFVTKELGTLLAQYGKRVLLIDMNFQTDRSINTAGAKEDNSVESHLSTMDYLLDLWREIKQKLTSFLKSIWRFGTKGNSLQQIMLTQTNNHKNLDYVFLSGENQALTSTQLFSPNTANFLQEMKKNYDLVLIDTDNVSRKADAAAAMKLSDFNFFVFRKGVSKMKTLTQCKDFVDSYQLKNVYMVMNGV